VYVQYIHLTEPRSWTGVADTKFPADGIVESNDIVSLGVVMALIYHVDIRGDTPAVPCNHQGSRHLIVPIPIRLRQDRAQD
jgi:hypothetical protein